MKYKQWILFFSLFTLFVSCEKSEHIGRQVQVQFSLCLPMQEQSLGQRRVMGDPGITEQLAFPRYAYIFVMRQAGNDWYVWKREELTLDGEWTATRYAGFWQQRGDSVYRYNVPVKYMLHDDNPVGRVYAVCSYTPLTFSQSLSSITGLDDLLNLKFSTSSDLVQRNLQNIYSTPYNYNAADGNTYYCSFDCSEGSGFKVDLLLYHVAAKVDLKWNVAEDKRINRLVPSNSVRLTYLEANHLFNGMAYCFRPLENSVATLPQTGYDIANIVRAEDEGLWWEGRYYFYTILYTVSGQEDYFPLQLTMRTNGSEGTGYKLTIKQQVNISDPFVPWIRGNLLLTQPLANTTETRIVN